MIDLMSRNAMRASAQKQVRFNDAECQEAETTGFRDRSYSNLGRPFGSRLRTSSLSLPTINSNWSPAAEADNRPLFQVLSVNRVEGTVKRKFSRRPPLRFSVAFTALSGVSLRNHALHDLSALIRVGDLVHVTKMIKFQLGAGNTEWRALDLEFTSPTQISTNARPANLKSTPSSRYASGSGDCSLNRTIWTTFGVVGTVNPRKRYMIIKTGIREGMVFADGRAIDCEWDKFRENMTVIARAELKREPGKPQPPAAPWYAVNVQPVGAVQAGQGILKKVRLTPKAAPFVIVANGFGWVMVPREKQAWCLSMYGDGQQVDFTACANLPCTKNKDRSRHIWKMLDFLEVQDSLDQKPEKTDVSTTTILPTNYSVATSCRTCLGALVCVCYK